MNADCSRNRRLFWPAIGVLLSFGVESAEPVPAASGKVPLPVAKPGVKAGSPSGTVPRTQGAEPLPLRMISPGVFQIGNVTIDRQKRTVSFPAVVNLVQGPMEYLLVSNYGKVHESILRTEAAPEHIHVAMLLLDAKPGPAADGGIRGAGRNRIETPSAELLAGARVGIELSWIENGQERRRPAEETVADLRTKGPLEKGKWIYNGSETVGGVFQAQASGSLVSLITDRSALLNNVATGHENDDNWSVIRQNLPAPGTSVVFSLRIEDAKTVN